MPVEVIVALISALASLAVAILTLVMQRHEATRLTNTSESLERLKGSLAEAKAERDAQRDYEYKARQRLYTQIQPLLFQLRELSESAYGRITGLARTARLGELRWLAEGYYLLSTIYRLTVPLAIFRLIQRRLTVVDFSVDEHVRAQYDIAKQLYFSASAGYDLASSGVRSISYKPGEAPHEAPAETAVVSAIYSQQHLFVGQIDIIADALAVREPDGVLRCMTYGEFENKFHDQESEVYRATNQVAAIFCDFDPRSKPVLWRILIAQAYLYKAFLRTFDDSPPVLASPAGLLSAEERQSLDWRQEDKRAADSPVLIHVSGEEVPAEEVLEWPFSAAEHYVQQQLPRLFRN